MGFAVMLSPDANNMTTHSKEHVMASGSPSEKAHCSSLSSHAACDDNSMTSGLCKAKCATSCTTTAPTQLSTLSFVFPYSIHTTELNMSVTHFNSRSISPELRPPLV